MSIQAVGWALTQIIPSSSAKFVLVAIANYADDQGVCWPSQQTLAADTSLTERSIRNAIGVLEELGFLKRVERRRQDGSRASDAMQILGFGTAKPQPENISGGLENPSAPTGKSFRTNRKMTTDQPENISGLTTFEPSKNHQEPSAAREPAREDPLAKLKTDIIKAFSAAGSMTLCPDTHRAETWVAKGYDPAIILATIREMLARKPNVKSLAYFEPAIVDAHQSKIAPIAKPIVVDDETRWARMLKSFASGDWSDWWGPPPGHPDCKIPAAFIAAQSPTPLTQGNAA